MKKITAILSALCIMHLSVPVAFAGNHADVTKTVCTFNKGLYDERKALLMQMIHYFEVRDLNGLLSMMADGRITFGELMGSGRVVHSKEKMRAILGKGFFSHLTKNNRWDVKRIIIDVCNNTAAVERISHMQYEGNNIVMPITAVVQFNNNNKLVSYQDFGDSALFAKQNKNKSWVRD